MNLHFSFKSPKTPEIEKEIQQHVQKLERYLHVFRPDLIHLHGTLDRGPRDGVLFSLNLRLPTGQLSAQDTGSSATAVVKLAFTELLGQIKRHKELLRSEHKWRLQRKERRGALRSVEEAVNQVVPSGASEPERQRPSNGRATQNEIDAATFASENKNLFQSDVRSYINANLPRLERFIARELRYRENSGQLQPDLVTPEEVIDEVVVSALSVEEKPPDVSLERWLYKLAIRAIQHVASGNRTDQSAMPLEQHVGVQNVSGSDESFLQFHQPGETMNREDILPDQRVSNPEEIAANDELIDQLENALRGTAGRDREAFVLFALEGFTLQEIAQVTERATEQVRQSIGVARNHLMKKLPPSNPLKQKLLQHSIVA